MSMLSGHGDRTKRKKETHIANRKLLWAHGPFEGTIALAYISGCGVFAAAKEIIKVDKN